jgi:O-antigen ligase
MTHPLLAMRGRSVSPRWWLLLASLPVALALVVLPLPFAAAAIAGLFFLVLVLIDPVWGLYAAILSVPVQEIVPLPAGLTVTQAVVVLAACAWMARVLAFPDRSLGLRFQWPWLLFLGWQLLAVVLTPYSLVEGFLQWARWIAAWLAFVLTLGTVTDRRRMWGLVAVLLLAPGLSALLGVLQFVSATGNASFLIAGGQFARATATFGKPNSYAGYLNMAWPLGVILGIYWMERWFDVRRLLQGTLPAAVRRMAAPFPYLRARKRGLLVLALLCGGVGALTLFGLFASYSRGGWLGAVGGMLGLALLAGRRSALVATGALLLALLVGVVGAFNVLPPVVVDRLGAITDNLRIFNAATEMVNDDNFAVVERMAHWQAAWRMWLGHPWLGIGPGNFNEAYREFFLGRWSISQGHAHNYYLHILAEAGPIGLLLYLVLIGTMFGQALRVMRRYPGTVWSRLALGGCGIMLAVAGHNIFENLHVLNLGIQLSGVWGLMIIAERLAHASEATGSEP